MSSHYLDQSDKPEMMRSFFFAILGFCELHFYVETRKMIIRHFQGYAVRWKASNDHKNQKL
jgi:hypothetical protein